MCVCVCVCVCVCDLNIEFKESETYALARSSWNQNIALVKKVNFSIELKKTIGNIQSVEIVNENQFCESIRL